MAKQHIPYKHLLSLGNTLLHTKRSSIDFLIYRIMLHNENTDLDRYTYSLYLITDEEESDPTPLFETNSVFELLFHMSKL